MREEEESEKVVGSSLVTTAQRNASLFEEFAVRPFPLRISLAELDICIARLFPRSHSSFLPHCSFLLAGETLRARI